MAIAKPAIAAGAVIAALIGTGFGVGSYFYVPDMPTYITVSQLNGSLASTYTTNTIGNVQQKYFVDSNNSSNK